MPGALPPGATNGRLGGMIPPGSHAYRVPLRPPARARRACELRVLRSESVGIGCGRFIAALHLMGLATLTHTPSPMGFLSALLGRPVNEKPYVLFPIGYPAPDAVVPDPMRKSLDEVVQWNRGVSGVR